MTQAEFETHDCTLGEESSCDCVKVEVTSDKEEAEWENLKWEQNASDVEDLEDF